MYYRRMRIQVVQSQWCGYRVIGIRTSHVLDIWPSTEWPTGREAFEIAKLWHNIRRNGESGLLLVGCDIAADPDDLAAMSAAVVQVPGDVHTGLVKLWPASTGRSDWMFSHRPGTLGNPAVTQDETAPVSYFSIGFVWLPGRLLDLASPAMEHWRWGETDVRLSELALEHGIPAHLVPGCQPKHLHFQEEHDGRAIQARATRTTAV